MDPLLLLLRRFSVEEARQLSISPFCRLDEIKSLLWAPPWTGAGSGTGITFPSLLITSVMAAEQLWHSQ
jgi:hypothetical protein